MCFVSVAMHAAFDTLVLDRCLKKAVKWQTAKTYILSLAPNLPQSLLAMSCGRPADDEADETMPGTIFRYVRLDCRSRDSENMRPGGTSSVDCQCSTDLHKVSHRACRLPQARRRLLLVCRLLLKGFELVAHAWGH